MEGRHEITSWLYVDYYATAPGVILYEVYVRSDDIRQRVRATAHNLADELAETLNIPTWLAIALVVLWLAIPIPNPI